MMDPHELRRRLAREDALASASGALAKLAAEAVTPDDQYTPVPDLKTQLSGLLGVAALARDAREVEVFLRYQMARKGDLRALGGRLAEKISRPSSLPGVREAGAGQAAEMEAVRILLGHANRLYTYIHLLQKDRRGEEAWGHVRRLAQ